VKKTGGEGHQTIDGNRTTKVQIGGRSIAADQDMAANYWIGPQQ
jgi:hypothetical protein